MRKNTKKQQEVFDDIIEVSKKYYNDYEKFLDTLNNNDRNEIREYWCRFYCLASIDSLEIGDREYDLEIISEKFADYFIQQKRISIINEIIK